ncbi:Putative pentatricopeptide repeat-containing protein At1g17630 [Linum perenne]
MRNMGNFGDGFTFPLVIRACKYLGSSSSKLCQVVHCHALEAGFQNHLHVSNELIGMYSKLGRMGDARKVFDRMSVRTTLSWNMMVSGSSFNCDGAGALEIFRRMESEEGSQMMRANLVSWTAVISGFASNGRGEEALYLFRQMQCANVMSNPITACSILSVCAELSALNLGKEIHGYTIRSFMSNNIPVQNGLIDMYTKCGSLREGHLVFEKLERKDLISWNSMIKGFGMHGLALDALDTFSHMISCGHQPDGITFVAVLSACSHAGLVDEGRSLFDEMLKDYLIEPQMEHYACMVDLLGRSGLLEEASDVVKNMPMEPNAYVLGALLNSCRMHKNTVVAENTASQMLSLSSNTAWSYMLLSNVYAASGRWEDSAKTRVSARTKGLKKTPGESWIEVNKIFRKFSAGDNVKEDSEEIYRVLEELTLQMEDISFNNMIPGISSVEYMVRESMLEDFSKHHQVEDLLV